MKKTAVGILLAMMCMLAGCGAGGENEKVVEKNNSQQESDVNQEGDAEQKNDGTVSEATGYVFKAADADGTGEVSIVIDAEAADILEGLGEAASVYESPSCAFGDLDIIYTYTSFQVDTYSMEGVEYISAVTLLDDTVSTPEGVCIGDDAAKVTDVYGEAANSTDTLLEYRKDHMKLSFIIQDGTVASIGYATTILE